MEMHTQTLPFGSTCLQGPASNCFCVGSAGRLSRHTLKSRKTSQTKIDRTAVHILNEPRPVALRKAPVIRLRVIGHIAEFSEPGARAGPSAYPDVTDRHYSFPQQSGPDNAGLSERWPNEGNLASYQARSAVMSTHTMTKRALRWSNWTLQSRG